MTEKEFWIFLNGTLAKGRTPQVSQVTDCKEALSVLKTYNENPGEELRFFAQFALEEGEMWNE